MQAESATLKHQQSELAARNASLVEERDRLNARANIQSSELARLRESNADVKREVAAMRRPFKICVGGASSLPLIELSRGRVVRRPVIAPLALAAWQPETLHSGLRPVPHGS